MRVWRISKRRYANTAFSGEGTKLVGGRWTPKGVRAVYTSSSLALAALELLVHLAKEDMGTVFVAISADIPDKLLIHTIAVDQLSENWRDTPAPAVLSAIGREWLQASQTAVLCVPSAVIAVERNFLLNPEHSDFERIKINQPEEFSFDSRLEK